MILTIKNHKHFIVVIILLCLTLTLNAQQDSQYTQYMYNTQVVNPAYAGNRGLLSINGLHRTQWVGLEGAPTTYSLTVNSPVGERVGLGFSFIKDEIGPSIENNLTVDFSYTIPIGATTNLSLGLKGGLNVLDVDYSKLTIFNQNDINFQNNINNRITPTIGLGFYLNGNDKWYLGLSSPNLLKTDHYNDIQNSEVTEEIHGYLIGGYVFNLNESLKFKPAALIKGVVGAPLAVDVSANFLFNEKFTLGAAYRLDAAVSALAAFQISDQLMIGYAYDYDTTELGNYNSGSHEIFLRFEFLKTANRIISPRFF